jgi:hypothetical protein
MTSTISWDTTPSDLVEVYTSFVGTYYLLLQVRRVLQANSSPIASLAYSTAPKMEVVCDKATSVTDRGGL